MAVIKLSKSGKAVLFVDDGGNVFISSVKYLSFVLSGRSKFPALLTRLPNKVPDGKFKLSPVLELDGSKSEAVLGSYAYNKLREESVPLGDLVEW
jgi:hypothetical protein